MPLEEVIANRRAAAQVLRAHGHEHDAKLIEEFASEVAESAEEYLRWIGETDAAMMSGKSEKWLRGQFLNWESLGHARKGQNGKREYRMLILPRRVNLSAAREEGRRAVRAA